ncbi:MAG: hypothetical protein ACKOWK_04425 [Micrococcales bacterium]
MTNSAPTAAPPSELRGTSFRVQPEHTFSKWVVILFLVPSIGSNIVLDPVRLGGTWLEWLPVALATYGVTLLAFGFARFAKARWTPQSGLVYALGVYLLIGWLRGLTAYFLALYLGIGTRQDLLFRLISPPIFAFIGLTVFAALVTTVVEQREALTAVRQERARLENAIQNFKSQHDRMRQELLERVSATIDPAIAELRAMLGRPQNEQNTIELLASMQVTADTIIRPLSHELATADSMHLELDTTGASSALGNVARMKRYQPELMAGWGALLSIALQLPALAVNYDILDATMSVFLLGFSLFINLKVLEGYTAHFRLSPVGGALVVIGGYVVAGITAPLFWGKTRWSLHGTDQISFTLIVLGIGIAMYVIGLANASRASYIAESASLNERMLQLVSQLRQQVWLDRRKVATVLHGPVQGALQSGAIRMARSGPSSQLAEQIREDMQEALDQLQGSRDDHYDFEEVLDSIIALWEDVVDFRINIDDEVRAKLAANPGAADTAIELVREAINNAMKHSSPTEISISLKALQQNVYRIRVWNNGCNLAESPAKGYGSQLFEELCLDWRLANDGEGVALEARVVS